MKLLVVGKQPLPFTLHQTLQKNGGVETRSLRSDVWFTASRQSFDAAFLWAGGISPLLVKKIVTEFSRRLPHLPLVVGEARCTSVQRAAILRCGARDCFMPRMSQAEIVTRLQLATYHTRSAPDPLPFVRGKFSFDFDQQTAFYQNIPIPLNRKETLLLSALLRRSNQVLSPQFLYDLVWDNALPPASNSLEVYMSSLRRKIEKPFALALFETMKGRGYRVRQEK